MDLPRIKYTTTSDGLSIAYYVTGHGDENTVIVMGLASHLELTWEIPGVRAVVTRLAEQGRVAMFDKRGLGLSERELGVGTFERRTEDIGTVMDAAGFDHANILGISEGGPMAVLFAATYPDRVDRLALVASFPWGGGEDTTAMALIEATWGSGTYARTAIGNAPKDPEVTGRLERNVATPMGISKLVRQNALIDVRPILGHVRVPTLVVHDRFDAIVPIAAGRHLARHIPEARLVEVANGWHWGWGEHDNDDIIDEIVAFVGGERRSPSDSSGRVLATVLFADIVGSTERAVDLGDLEWRRLLDRYETSARETVRKGRGRWINFTGDGIVAVFDGPGRGVECARELRDSASATLGLSTRRRGPRRRGRDPKRRHQRAGRASDGANHGGGNGQRDLGLEHRARLGGRQRTALRVTRHA